MNTNHYVLDKYCQSPLVIPWILIYIIDSATQLIDPVALSRPLNSDLLSLFSTGFRNLLNLYLFLSPLLAGR